MDVAAAVRSAGRRAGDRSIVARSAGSAGFPKSEIVQGLSVAAISAGLIWLVWIYGTGLRDPRYLDGWILAAGMAVQLYFHIAIKTARLSPKSAIRWRAIHIFLGYVLIAVFLSHCDFSLPDTPFEWALWTGFVLVALTGVFGVYLAWTLKAKRGFDESMTSDRIATRRTELARAAHAIVATTKSDQAAFDLDLPMTGHDDWIVDLHSNHLREFFNGPSNTSAHLIGSERPLKRLMEEIDSLSRYVDSQGQEKLAVIRELVTEKDRLDFAAVHLVLTKGWLLVHVPATYGLIVLSVMHVIVAYSFSSGAW